MYGLTFRFLCTFFGAVVSFLKNQQSIKQEAKIVHCNLEMSFEWAILNSCLKYRFYSHRLDT